jgi:RNA polymerase sigma factor (sigma-70 family)
MERNDEAVQRAGGATGMVEEQAVKCLQAGRRIQEAWAFLYREYRYMVLCVLCARCHDTALCEDITEDVFVALPDIIGRYDPAKCKFTTWLCRVAINLLIDHVRRQGFEAECITEYVKLHPVTRKAVGCRCIKAQYYRYWDMLPEHEKVIYHQHCIEGYPLPDVARMHNVTKRHVKYIVHDCNRRIREAHERDLRNLARLRLSGTHKHAQGAA